MSYRAQGTTSTTTRHISAHSVLTGPSRSLAALRLDLSFGATTAFSCVPLPPEGFGRFLEVFFFSGAGRGFFAFSSCAPRRAGISERAGAARANGVC